MRRLGAELGPPLAFAQTAPSATEPRSFAEIAASSNMFEVESSQLALERATNDDVRAFAEHMIEDHTAAGDKMQAAAKKDGITPPAAMAQKEQAQLEQIQSAAGEGFDQAYLAARSRPAVALFDTFSSQGEESALRTFAAETLPTLQDHQAAVHELAGS